MLSCLTLTAPSRRPVLIQLYAVGIRTLATLPCSVNPHEALAGKLNYPELLICLRKEFQIEDQGPLNPIFHGTSIIVGQRPSHGEEGAHELAAGGAGVAAQPQAGRGWKAPVQPHCCSEDKPLVSITTTQEKEMGLKTKTELPNKCRCNVASS